MSFENASVTKGLMVGYGLTSILSGLFDVKHYFHLQLVPHLSRHHQYWRLVLHQLAFSSSSDLFIAQILLYNAGVHVERRFGSIKFATAISRLPSSGAVAIIGLVVGQIYRSDLANLKAYRLSPTVVNFATRFLLPFVGSLRPPRRSNRALPDESRASSTRNTTAAPQNEEVITTARPSASTTPRHRQTETNASGAATGSGSVMREWVDELTGRTDRAAAGIRVPPEAEINQLTTMFPDVQRDVIVAALQRRSFVELIRILEISTNIEAAVETLLSSQT
ncbi:hypothetical protein H0H92_014561 [Tricholoma furcatifolium]|nr:hypothetical protein H0H92_014561 [Tricholoma furcatifolium]